MKPLPRSASHPGNYSSSMRKFEQTHTMLNNMSGMEQFVFLISVCTKKGKCIGFNYAGSGPQRDTLTRNKSPVMNKDKDAAVHVQPDSG